MNFPFSSSNVTRVACALSLLLAGHAWAAPAKWTRYADLILTNAQVVKVDEAFTFAQGVAIKEGKIIEVGSNEQVLAHRGPDTRVSDLQGRVVIPGLQDSHIHPRDLGYDAASAIELSFANSQQEVLNTVRAFIGRTKPKPGQQVVGGRWDQYKYPMVTRWQLDTLGPDNPIRLWRNYRGLAVNTALLNQKGIYDERPETWPAWWQKDPATFTPEDHVIREKRTVTIEGRPVEMEVPNGIFLGRNAELLLGPKVLPSNLEKDVESMRLGCETLLSNGVTAMVDAASRMGYMMRVYQETLNRGLLKIRVSNVYEGIFYTETPEWIREHFDQIKINNLGDSWLRWRGVKFYGDGGSGTRSAWVSEPYVGEPDNFGLPVQGDSAKREAQYRAALEYGWSLHTHSCGDMAMRQTVDLYMKLMDEIHRKDPQADLRWSVIHAYLPLEPKTRVLEDMARYKIIACINPIFNWQEGRAHTANLGEERMARFQPARSYIKAGVKLVCGSDYSVTAYDPWISIYALLTRREQISGKVYGPDETIDIADALRTYTINGAYLVHEEDIRGSVEVGKLADLVVLDLKDIREFDRDPEIALKMAGRVLLTMVEGKVQYTRPGFAY